MKRGNSRFNIPKNSLPAMKKQLLQITGLIALSLFSFFGEFPEAQAQAFDMRYNATLSGSNSNQTTLFELYQNCDIAGQGFSNFIYETRINAGTPITETFNGPFST